MVKMSWLGDLLSWDLLRLIVLGLLRAVGQSIMLLGCLVALSAILSELRKRGKRLLKTKKRQIPTKQELQEFCKKHSLTLSVIVLAPKENNISPPPSLSSQ